jgi:hypothetical protein
MTSSLVVGAKHALRETFQDLQYWQRRRHYHRSDVSSVAHDGTVVEGLRKAGGFVTSLNALNIARTPEMLDAADELFAAIANRAAGKGGFVAHATPEEIERYPALIGWGLDERLLEIVENYICMPVDYRGLTVRRDIVGGDALETRLWHRDYEDIKIVKIIVYLNDVDRGGGAYEFIPRPKLPIWRVAQLGGRIDETAMSRIVPEADWQNCSGPRGTVVFSDTCSVYHRGTVAHTEDRKALFFCYNSKSPRAPQHCMPLFDREGFAEAAQHLSMRQRAAIGL